MQLLDTDVLIDVQRGHPPALAWFGGLTELPSVPGFVVMELLQDAQNARQVQAALKLVAPLPIVWHTDTDCARALSNFAALHLSQGLGLLDSLIAACAVGCSAELCTFNVKHYLMVPDLRLIKPYSRWADLLRSLAKSGLPAITCLPARNGGRNATNLSRSRNDEMVSDDLPEPRLGGGDDGRRRGRAEGGGRRSRLGAEGNRRQDV